MNNLYIFNILSQIPILKNLNAELFQAMCSEAQVMKFKKHEIVYEAQSPKTHVFLVINGSIKLAIETCSQKILTKELVYKNEIFGENVFGDLKIYNEYAETLSETTLVTFPIECFKDAIKQNHDFASDIMKVIVHKFQQLEERLQNFVFLKAKERIVQFIINTGLSRGRKIGLDECLVEHGMSHKEIAYLTDTSRQTVARIMNELKKENIIHYSSFKSGKVLIRNIHTIKNYISTAS